MKQFTNTLNKEQLDNILKLRKEKGLSGKKQSTKMPRNSDNVYPLSNAQQQFWFQEQWNSEHYLQNNPVYANLDFGETIDAQLIEIALNEIINRNDILRTSFFTKEGIPYQRVEDNVAIHIKYADVRHLSLEEKEKYLQLAAKEEALQVIPLDKAPLLRLGLIRSSETEYLFLYTPHHIISDGWSNALFIKELVQRYSSLLAGLETDAMQTPAAFQYIDYVASEQVWLRSDEYIRFEEYWQNTLTPLPPPVRLPYYKQRPSGFAKKGKKEVLPIGTALTEQINQFCKENDITPFVYFLTSLYILLYRYSYQPDIVIGVPTANRGDAEFQDVLGLFINTLPYKQNINPKQSFLELAVKIKESSYNNLKHQKIPFNKIVSALDTERDLGTSPLFQVMFAFQNIPSLYSIGDIKIKPYKIDLGLATYDLDFWVEEFSGEFVITLTANVEIFANTIVRNIIEHYHNVVNTVVTQPNIKVMDIDYIGATEKCILLNNSKTYSTLSHIPTSNLKELIERHTQTRPQHIAVESNDKSITYSDLDKKANRIANFITTQNTNKKPVLIFLNRGIDMIVALVAANKSGVPFVPLAADFPLARIKYILSDSQASIIITEQKLLPIIQELNAIKCIVDNNSIEKYSDTPPAVQIDNKDIAYIMYTSGTTGNPKGVAVSHFAVIAFSFAMSEQLQLKADARFANVSTFAADLGYSMIFPSLLLGATLLICTESEVLSPSLLSKRFSINPPNYLKLVPAHLNALLVAGKSVLPFDKIIFAGESLGVALVQRIIKLAPELEILQFYGPTETTISITYYNVKGDEQEIPIGRPFKNTYIYILDANKNLIPIGAEGEIYIGGLLLSDGYFNNMELTAEKFIQSPFSNNTRDILFRTGDMGIWNEDGDIIFKGRSDRQVKIRGFRVELGEVEKRLEAIDGVEQAVALFSDATQKQLWVAVKTNGKCAEADIRQLLANNLPNYMLPDKLLITNTIPFTANGKVNYRELVNIFNASAQEPQRANIISNEELSDEQLSIQSIFNKIFKQTNIGIDESFFDIGGNSLISIELLYHINNQFNTNLTLPFLFRNPTIRMLAKGIKQDVEIKDLKHSHILNIKESIDCPVNLFLIHPAGGYIYNYLSLAELINRNVSIYAIQVAPGEQQGNSISHIASDYLDELTLLNIKGKMIFGGWSLGANIAYEMATQLGKRKNIFPTVLVLDNPAYSQNNSLNFDEAAGIVEFVAKVSLFVQKDIGITKEMLASLTPLERSKLFYERFSSHNLIPQGIGLNDFNGFIELMLEHNRIIYLYKPPRYSGNVVVIKAEAELVLQNEHQDNNMLLDTRPEDLLWRSVADNVQVISTPGNHITMMRPPFIGALANNIEKIIDAIKS
ncbi:MAG: amino acid adenylation domain-containing protein [Ignavibacteria bacterium]|jgi:amino acid adenylation domain-containing protein|nr:amino acid adenylation domain-containing protein [Ignavibacteria bacterium]